MITRLQDYNLRAANTFRLDARCDEWIEYTSADDLPALRGMIGDRRHMSIGQGANLLFADDFKGVVLQSKILDIEISHSRPGELLARVGSGVSMDAFIAQCASQLVWGLENLSGIPGHVGASAVQNVGAYGVEAGDRIVLVEAYDMVTGEYIEFNHDDCRFAYRDSIFKHHRNRYVITYVTYRLSTVPVPVLDYGHLRKSLPEDRTLSPMAVREAVLAMREAKLPAVDEIGSAGSFFKNPVVSEAKFKKIQSQSDTDVPHYIVGADHKIPAAWLIDQCGLKGYSIGGAQVWRLQPLIIVNASGHATATEILAVESHVLKLVRDRFGIELQPEVDHIY